jgi:hypothetical protein
MDNPFYKHTPTRTIALEDHAVISDKKVCTCHVIVRHLALAMGQLCPNASACARPSANGAGFAPAKQPSI